MTGHQNLHVSQVCPGTATANARQIFAFDRGAARATRAHEEQGRWQKVGFNRFVIQNFKTVFSQPRANAHTWPTRVRARSKTLQLSEAPSSSG